MLKFMHTDTYNHTVPTILTGHLVLAGIYKLSSPTVKLGIRLKVGLLCNTVGVSPISPLLGNESTADCCRVRLGILFKLFVESVFSSADTDLRNVSFVRLTFCDFLVDPAVDVLSKFKPTGVDFDLLLLSSG